MAGSRERVRVLGRCATLRLGCGQRKPHSPLSNAWGIGPRRRVIWTPRSVDGCGCASF